MKRSIVRYAIAAALLVGGGALAEANAAVAGPGTAPAADAAVSKTATVCGPYGCRYVPGPRYYRPPPPRYGYGYYGPPRRCAWRVRPTPYGPRNVRVCW